MANAQHITDLLKVAKDIPILNTGIHNTAQEYFTYPVKEHNRLLSSSGKPVSTPLNSLFVKDIERESKICARNVALDTRQSTKQRD